MRTTQGWGNQQNIFFMNFFFILFSLFGSSVLVFVAQISGSNKSYGCVDDIHANQIFKEPYFECFQDILYLSFIRYHPVVVVFFLSLVLSWLNFFQI